MSVNQLLFHFYISPPPSEPFSEFYLIISNFFFKIFHLRKSHYKKKNLIANCTKIVRLRVFILINNFLCVCTSLQVYTYRTQSRYIKRVVCIYIFTITQSRYAERSWQENVYQNTEKVYRDSFAVVCLLEHRVGIYRKQFVLECLLEHRVSIQRVFCSNMFTRTQNRYMQRIVCSYMFTRTQSRYTESSCRYMFTRIQSRNTESSCRYMFTRIQSRNIEKSLRCDTEYTLYIKNFILCKFFLWFHMNCSISNSL